MSGFGSQSVPQNLFVHENAMRESESGNVKGNGSVSESQNEGNGNGRNVCLRLACRTVVNRHQSVGPIFQTGESGQNISCRYASLIPLRS